MNFFLDKLVDGLFIFIGVYVAFAFGQCQEDQRKKAELKFHLERIMKDLSTKEPSETVNRLKIKRTEITDKKTREKGCHVNTDLVKTANTIEPKHLEQIFNNCLSMYIKNKRSLSALSKIVFEFQPMMINAQTKYLEKTTEEIFNLSEYIEDKQANKRTDPCGFKSKQINKRIKESEDKLTPTYVQTLLYSGVIKKIGYICLNILKKEGFQPELTKTQSFNFNIKFNDSDSENSDSEEKLDNERNRAGAQQQQ